MFVAGSSQLFKVWLSIEKMCIIVCLFVRLSVCLSLSMYSLLVKLIMVKITFIIKCYNIDQFSDPLDSH